MTTGRSFGAAQRLEALLGASAIAIGSLATPALAQDTTPEAERGGVEEIVVTARKRIESTQDVPVAVVAISAERIERYDLTSLERIAAQTPTFSIGRAPSGAGATLVLRGIGSNTTSIGLEQSVAVIVDGTYYGQGRTINEGFFDLGQLEILKGPQALFFGKNATAGVVSITTADPGDTLEVIARAGYEFAGNQLLGEAILFDPGVGHAGNSHRGSWQQAEPRAVRSDRLSPDLSNARSHLDCGDRNADQPCVRSRR